MSYFLLNQSQSLKLNLNDAWDFFSDPRNLVDITPPSLDFRISDRYTRSLHNGQIIQYKLRPLPGYTVKWISEISRIVVGKQFTDSQVKGPYSHWQHRHIFTEINGGVKIDDEVEYALSFGPLDSLINKFFIKKQLHNIFSYRKSSLRKIFGEIET